MPLVAVSGTIEYMKPKNGKIVHYDKEADVLAVYLSRGRAEELAEIAPGISVELGSAGNVVGFEILNASKVLRSFLNSAKRPGVHARA